MISFKPTEEEQAVADVVHDLAATRLRPATGDIERDAAMIGPALKTVDELGLIQSMAEASMEGSDLYARVLSTIVLEELAWGNVNVAASFASTTGFVRAVADHGSRSQVEATLAHYATAHNPVAAIAAVETGLNFSPRRIHTTFRTEEGGAHVLDGTKTLVPRATDCRHFLVVARDGDDLVAVIVPSDADGVSIGRSNETMGLTAQGFADVTFDNVRLPADARLCEAAGVQTLVTGSLTAASAILTGLCRAVYEHSVEYTKMRSAHGSALARKQAVALRLVDMFIDVEAMRWMSWRAATHIDKGIGGVRSARLAHVHAVKRANWIADEGVQFMGGHGFITENPVEAWYRNAKTVATMQMTFGI